MGKMTDNRYMAKQKTMAFQIDPEIRSILDEQKEIQDRSISWLINHYLRKAFVSENLMKPKEKPKR